MERDYYYENAGSHIGGASIGAQLAPTTVTSLLRGALEHARQIAEMSDKLSYRVAGPRPEAAELNRATLPADDNGTLMRLAEELSEVVGLIGRNLEYAHNRV